jgi:hypothetical protein
MKRKDPKAPVVEKPTAITKGLVTPNKTIVQNLDPGAINMLSSIVFDQSCYSTGIVKNSNPPKSIVERNLRKKERKQAIARGEECVSIPDQLPVMDPCGSGKTVRELKKKARLKEKRNRGNISKRQLRRKWVNDGTVIKPVEKRGMHGYKIGQT